jgi:hypothetical protein
MQELGTASFSGAWILEKKSDAKIITRAQI